MGAIPLKTVVDLRAAKPVMTPWARRRFTAAGGPLWPRGANLDISPMKMGDRTWDRFGTSIKISTQNM